jgi:hypothetical protein
MALARYPCVHAVKIDARKVGRDLDGTLAVRHGNLVRGRMSRGARDGYEKAAHGARPPIYAAKVSVIVLAPGSAKACGVDVAG